MNEKVDMRKNPYRGVFTEVAAELGLHRNSVRDAYLRRSPRIVALVRSKLAQRTKMVGGRHAA